MSASTEIERRTSGESRKGTAAPGLGLLKGLGVTIKHLFKRTSTQQYPHEKPDLAPRTRGVIALMDENCTVCMLCARECPDWCIYIESHKETVPPAREGGRARTRNVLDRFAIDFALCMYCGICIEVCPFDALFWSPEFEYSEYSIEGLLHEMGKLREWMDTVPPPPPLDEGAETPGEVAGALEKAEAQLEQARQERREALEEAQADEATEKAKAATGGGAATAAGGGGAATTAEPEPEVELEEGAIDQETFDRLVEEGASERVARAKAKAAAVRKAKKEAREKQAAAKEAAAEPEVELEEGAIDQETFDRLVEEGASERVARAKAKAAAVRKAKKKAREEQAAQDGDGDEADDGDEAGEDATS